jgi:hypothetical protein
LFIRWRFASTFLRNAVGRPPVGTIAVQLISTESSGAVVTAETVDPRWQQLVDLVGKLPPAKAEKLHLVLGAENLTAIKSGGFVQVLKALEVRRAGGRQERAAEPLMCQVCRVLEPFLVDEDDNGDAGVIRRQSLMPWWEASLSQSMDLRDLDRQFQRVAKANMRAEMERLEEEAMAELARLAKTLSFRNIGQAVMEDVRRIGIVFAGGAAFAKVLSDLGVAGPPKKPGLELDAVLVRRFRQAYEVLGTNRHFDPVWLGHAVMNHLVRPWEVVTLIHRVTGSTDIRMLEQTELAPLIDRTIDQLVSAAAQAKRAIKDAARQRVVEATMVATRSATDYFDLAEAVAREIKLERNSQWGRAYMASRNELADLISGKLEDFEKTITDFVDDWTPAESGRWDHPAFLAAVAAADFIGAMKFRGARHGFGMPFAGVDRRLRDALGRPMKRPAGNAPDGWPTQKRRLLEGLSLI